MNDKKIYFPENIFDLISDILKKNGAEETIEESVFKENSFIDAVYDLLENMALKKTAENEAINFVKNKINVSDTIAKNIVKSIKEELLPLTESGDLDKKADNNLSNNLSKKIYSNRENKNTIVDKIQRNNEESTIKKSKKPDSYRELIE
jgi:hypothetical protein